MTKQCLWVRDADADVLREATHEEIISAARSCLARRVGRGAVLQSPGATRDFILVELSERSHETFCVLYLDNRHRVIAWQELFRGTIDGASVHPREVVKEALSRSAAACILVHNHPLCFVRGVNLEPEREFGLALSSLKLPRRRGRQGAARLTTASLRCSPEVASQACDGARCGVGCVLVGNPAHSRE
jgi:hypothetical protein